MRVSASASYKDGNKLVNVTLSVFFWNDEGIYYAYSPALDIAGYGHTEDEAKESFSITLEEYLKYTHNKNTIFEELEKLGWTVNKKKKRVKSPELQELLTDNEHFQHIYSSKAPKEECKNIELFIV